MHVKFIMVYLSFIIKIPVSPIDHVMYLFTFFLHFGFLLNLISQGVLGSLLSKLTQVHVPVAAGFLITITLTLDIKKERYIFL